MRSSELLAVAAAFLVVFVLDLGLAEVSNRLETELSPVQPGQPLDLACTVTSPQSRVDTCSWNTPDGHTYSIDGLVVTDENSDLVPGVVVDPNDPASCKITVLQLSPEQVGTWSCQVSLTGVNPYQVAFLNAITDPRVSDVRIPAELLNAVRPDNYVVTLIPHIVVDDWEIEGQVAINLKSSGQLNQMVLHIKDIVIYEDTVEWLDKDSGDSLAIEGFGYDQERDFFIIYLAQDFNANSDMTISLKFRGLLNDDLSGFYRSSYVAEDGTTHYLAASQFQATDARKAFPCMDEPGIKARFTIQLGRTSSFTSASNMPIAVTGAPIPGNPDYVLDIFQETLPMATYLLAFLISDFTYREGTLTQNQVPFRIWSQPGLFNSTEYAAQIGPQILQFYEEYFDVPFPLPKQDMAALPDLSFGGMENWGLITYRESVLLYEDGVSSLQDRDRVLDVVSHELAHQWFGDLVTMAWWSDLWLNEGFATYVALSGSNLVEPDFGQSDRAILTMNQVAYALDALDSSHPVQVTVNHPDEINEIFDDISYEKGAALIRMMVNFLGEDTFRKGVSDYLKQHQYSNTVTDDLWNALNNAAVEDGVLDSSLTVKTIMDNWTLIKGFPVVTVTRSDPGSAPKDLVLEQRRFLVGDSDPDDTTDYQWYVPISYTFVGGDFDDTKNQEWLPPNAGSFPLQLPDTFPASEAFVINVQGTGFYRVNYDPTNWNSLAQALESDPSRIHVTSRAQLVDDALNLAKQGSLSYDIALAMTEYLNVEEEYVPWSSSRSGLSYIQLMLQRSADYALLTDYLTEKVIHLYNRLGYDASPQDRYFDVLLRGLALNYLCGFGYPDCVARATSDFSDWMSTPNPDAIGANPIDTSVRSITYCTAIAAGTDNEWNFLQQRFINSNNANEKNTILSGLGCSTDEATLQRYMDMALDTSSMLRVTDGLTVVRAVSSNPKGTAIAWSWMQNNWADIRSYYDTAVSSPVGRMVTTVTRSFNTAQELQELQQFYSDNQGNLGTAQSATETAITSTQANVAWMQNNYDSVVGWLQNRP